MCSPIEGLLLDFQRNEAVCEDVIAQAEADIGMPLPSDYRDFISNGDGGEGFIGKHYLILWPVHRIAQYNCAYQVEEYAPGIVLIGSTGGGEGFGYDTRSGDFPIVQVPFVGLDLRSAIKVADSFSDLLFKMSKCDGSLF